MIGSKKTTFIFFFLLSSALFPLSVNAGGLVPCGGPGESACTFCNLLQMGQNIVNFVFYNIAIPLVALFIVVGGFYIMTAGGSAERVKKGRDTIKTAVIGLAILFLSWIFVDILIRILGGSSQPSGFNAPWYEIGRNLSC